MEGFFAMFFGKKKVEFFLTQSDMLVKHPERGIIMLHTIKKEIWMQNTRDIDVYCFDCQKMAYWRS